MNDENLENYLYSQFNEILDSDDDTETKQKKLGNLFMTAGNSISAIYLVNNQDETKKMMAQMLPEVNANVDFANLLKNEWYIYTNIEIWIDFLYSVYNEILPSHPQFAFFGQVMDAVKTIERQSGITKNHLVS